MAKPAGPIKIPRACSTCGSVHVPGACSDNCRIDDHVLATIHTLCRHEPSVTITSINQHVESYICSCKRCGRLIAVDVRTGNCRVA